MLALVFLIVAGGMYLYQFCFFDWERPIIVKHVVIDVACGLLASVFTVFALFVWVDGRKR